MTETLNQNNHAQIYVGLDLHHVSRTHMWFGYIQATRETVQEVYNKFSKEREEQDPTSAWENYLTAHGLKFVAENLDLCIINDEQLNDRNSDPITVTVTVDLGVDENTSGEWKVKLLSRLSQLNLELQEFNYDNYVEDFPESVFDAWAYHLSQSTLCYETLDSQIKHH